MTNDEYELIADVLRHRVNEITKLFEDGAFVPTENAPHAMKAQIRILTNELENAFRKRDPMLKHGILTEAVRDQDVTTPTGFVLGWANGWTRVIVKHDQIGVARRSSVVITTSACKMTRPGVAPS